MQFNFWMWFEWISSNFVFQHHSNEYIVEASYHHWEDDRNWLYWFDHPQHDKSHQLKKSEQINFWKRNVTKINEIRLMFWRHEVELDTIYKLDTWKKIIMIFGENAQNGGNQQCYLVCTSCRFDKQEKNLERLNAIILLFMALYAFNHTNRKCNIAIYFFSSLAIKNILFQFLLLPRKTGKRFSFYYYPNI